MVPSILKDLSHIQFLPIVYEINEKCLNQQYLGGLLKNLHLSIIITGVTSLESMNSMENLIVFPGFISSSIFMEKVHRTNRWNYCPWTNEISSLTGDIETLFFIVIYMFIYKF